MNGGNSYQTAQYEDGMLSTSMDGGTTLNSISVGDEEIKVVSSAMPAEYGHATSGALIVVKKAGTNSSARRGRLLIQEHPHGRSAASSRCKPTRRRVFSSLVQKPDFVVSGPVWIPHIYNGKNRTFFEVAGNYHMGYGANAGIYTTPTTAMLAGNYQRIHQRALRS